MRTEFTRQRRNLMSNYGQNALIQLIAASAVGFILAYAMYIIILVIAPNQQIEVDGMLEKVTFSNAISPYVALQPFKEFLHRPWTVLTYAWVHSGFWALLTGMMWLYCFGSVIQSLVGFKEIIPMFLFSSIIGGLVFIGVSAIWPNMGGNQMILGALPATMGFALGAITLAPKFRFYLGDRLAIPLWVVLAIFLGLNLLTLSNGNITTLAVCLSSALVGFVYIKLLQNGYKPGAWLYGSGNKIQHWFAPAEFNAKNPKRRTEAFKKMQQTKTASPEESIDMLLDKINQKGYDSLTKEEKDMLMNASKER